MKSISGDHLYTIHLKVAGGGGGGGRNAHFTNMYVCPH